MVQLPPATTVLQVIPDLNSGGAERTTLDVARSIVDAGGTALVVSQGGQLVGGLKEAGAEHIVLPVKSKNPLTLWQNAARLTGIIQERNVSIIHARSRAPAWSSLWAARRAKVPFVTTYHGTYNQSGALKAFYNSVMARGDAVIANSNFIADLIGERHAFAADRITVIERGSDLKALARENVSALRQQALKDGWGVPSGRPMILNMARLTAWKGQKVVIEAMALLKEAGLTGPIAILAGDAQGRDGYTGELKKMIADRGLHDSVRLVGHCADVPAALALADISVVASVEPEAFGRAAVEAQAAGVPVIVSDLGAVKETVLAPPQAREDERTGWRVPPGDPQALADAIRMVLDLDPATRNQVTDRALSHVRRNFSVETMCAKTLEVYTKLLSEPFAAA
ncbi:glycosyltransferase family 4 protein [Roseibium salinum]|uniref:Glycosyltransferase family 4 protein n=1 Tax=Roseibium salinum TaxID=1604349 RepID=A0ABT3R6U3_9HYPH|nr:glycosyltransferase family 4 protein [Roseibium sp. DSM 29163]MCX2725016.1 glycosyltransferase family 4 protein [Roseibium sp. DSM 29163]MDN3721069.1 glycosyltransferase family 4 protein [Roseibium salinum]